MVRASLKRWLCFLDWIGRDSAFCTRLLSQGAYFAESENWRTAERRDLEQEAGASIRKITWYHEVWIEQKLLVRKLPVVREKAGA